MVFTTEVGSFLPCDVQCLCVILWAGPSDSILTNRIWDCIIKNTHNCGFSLFLIHSPISLPASLTPSPYLPPSVLSWPVSCHDSSCWEQSYGKAHMVQWGTFSYILKINNNFSYPMRKISLPATTWNEFKRDPSAPVQSWLMTLLQFHQRCWARIIQLRLFCIPGPWNCK